MLVTNGICVVPDGANKHIGIDTPMWHCPSYLEGRKCSLSINQCEGSSPPRQQASAFCVSCWPSNVTTFRTRPKPSSTTTRHNKEQVSRSFCKSAPLPWTTIHRSGTTRHQSQGEFLMHCRPKPSVSVPCLSAHHLMSNGAISP